jgi:hypothetical protein
MANVTMLNGDGAAGKTTIALQLLAATVRGTDWLGSVVDEPGKAIFLTAEEDQDEIHRRCDAIVAHQGIGFEQLAGLNMLCMPGVDPVLGSADKAGVIRATPLFESLLKAAAEIRPTLIAIEAAADVFAGNENDRSQVRQFLGLLRRLAVTTGAAVLLIAQLRGWAHAHQIPQSAFSDLLGVYAGKVAGELALGKLAHEAEVAKLGAAGPGRIDALATYLRGQLGDLGRALTGVRGADGLVRGGVLWTAEIVGAFEALMNKQRTQGAASYTGNGRDNGAQDGKIAGYEKMTFEQRRHAQEQRRGR